jgi:hypothetical protein
MRAVMGLAALLAAVLLMSLASAWLIGAKWGHGAVPDPIRRSLGVTPK